MEDVAVQKKDKNEILWNADLIKAIESKLVNEFSDVKVIKGKILKDIFLYTDKSHNHSIQFGFVDQDIIIYQETMDISDLEKSKNVLLHKNNTADADKLIIPKIICELKYNGITSHGLIIYSEYAADIKSIFPDCKYFLALRYKKNSTSNKLFRHGKNFDKIIAFDNGQSKGSYKKGDFLSQLKSDKELKKKFGEFIDEIKKVLQVKHTFFTK